MAGQMQTAALMDTNQYTKTYGLVLTQEEAKWLVSERAQALQEQKRVELTQSVLPKLIYEFCDSSYITQDAYAETIARLQEIFFQYKNEMLDEITDAELLHFMKEQFEGICGGDLEYLEGTCLNLFAQAVRAGYSSYQRTDGYHAYQTLDEVTRWDRDLYLEALSDLFG